MNSVRNRASFPFGHVAVSAVLVLLIAYTYAKFFALPYAGFEFNPSSGELTLVFIEPPAGDQLQVGDRLLQVGPVSWDTFQPDFRQTLFAGVAPGDQVLLEVERGGLVIPVSWTFPGRTRQEVRERILGVLLVSYVFWLAGAGALLLVRPFDTRRGLLIAFFLLTAVWIACGSLSAWHFWGSPILLRMAIWLCVPVYLHFHWVFPRPLGRLPALTWPGLYLAAGSLALLEVAQIPPRNAYLLGFLAALTGSLVLLVAHVIMQPDQRPQVRLVAVAAMVILIPAVVVSLTGLMGQFPDLVGLIFLSMPVLPGAYFYAIYRRPAGGLEVRGNRLISIYLFVILVGTIAAALIGSLSPMLRSMGLFSLGGTLGVILVALISIQAFPRFQRLVEHRLLQMPLPPAHLVEVYAERITTSLSRRDLIRLLDEEVLPSLQVQESALLLLGDQEELEVITQQGVMVEQLPDPEGVAQLLGRAGKRWPTDRAVRLGDPCPWALLVLPLNLAGKTRGLWLLGRRDPDDDYTEAEIAVLQVLANQTAIALNNLLQAEQLHALYQADMDRQEAERTRFARWLHDDVLTELSVLKMSAGDQVPPEQFDQQWQELTDRIRQVMGGLRPVMLTYGLGEAISELADDLNERAPPGTQVHVEVADAQTRYGERAEGHLFRIVQEACENALKHADAGLIRISGVLEPGRADLAVEDDGAGFEVADGIEFASLLSNRHYGLVTMYERAALIGANLQVHSQPGAGTVVHVVLEA